MDGVKLTKKEMQPIEARLERSKTLPKYDITILPKDLPVGTKLVVSGAFDNSALNVSNPDPTISVGWGDQSWFEMFVGFIDIAQ